jgi:hypothetical protein
MSLALRIAGLAIMCFCAILVVDCWNPSGSSWVSNLRFFGIISFFVGLLMLVEGILMELRSPKAKSIPVPAPKTDIRQFNA